MPEQSMTKLAVRLIPSLANSLAEQFNIFRIMHHGTHEKQLSNVFSWLLDADGTHHLGDAFQRIFIDGINEQLDPDEPLPASDYRITQEIDTSGERGLGKDIADIVLTRPDVRIVVENFFTSDGHGHSYDGYLDYGSLGGRRGVVVLLAITHEPYRQTDGWQAAPVLTYARILEDLRKHVEGEKKWRRENREQHFFIMQLIDHYVEGPRAMNTDENLDFIKVMCETGESGRYGHRPIADAVESFAQQVAQHARHQFNEGRALLLSIKRGLRTYGDRILKAQLNDLRGEEYIAEVKANYVGQWEWYVTLRSKDSTRIAGLVFGPTAATCNAMVEEPLPDPDYGKVFILGKKHRDAEIDFLVQSQVGLKDVLDGIDATDTRLRDDLLEILGDH